MMLEAAWITRDRKYHKVRDFHHEEALTLDGLGEKYLPAQHAKWKAWSVSVPRLQSGEITPEEYQAGRYPGYEFRHEAMQLHGFVRIVVYTDCVYAEGVPKALLNAMPKIKEIAGDRRIDTHPWDKPSTQPTPTSVTPESSSLLTARSAA